MARLKEEKIKKLKRGEAIGYACAAVCALAIAYFIAGFTLGEAYGLYSLKLSTLICAPVLAAASAFGAAYCNLKFGGALESEVREYVKQTFIGNAALMHPEKTSLNFAISVSESGADVKVNNFKEKILFDFSSFGKLSAVRKSSVYNEIANVLTVTFCRLYDRGVKLTEVSYSSADKKNGRVNYIILDGTPDKKAYKTYTKLK